MRDFFKSLLASLLALFIFSGLSAAGLIVLLVAIFSSADSGPQVRNKSVLLFDLSTTITDAGPVGSRNQFIEEALSDNPSTVLSLRTVVNTIDQAAQDKRIVALYLFGNGRTGAGANFANLREIRQALQRFRASGKPILAYDTNWEEKEYYLASAANTVVLNPFGSMEMNGFQSQNLFLKGALQKYGIGMQVTRVGKYKSAVEPFLLTKSSPQEREQTKRLLDDLWGEFLTTVSKERKLPATQLQKTVDTTGVLLADEAQKNRLVDRVAYLDEVVSDLKGLTGNKPEDRTFRQVDLATYAKAVEPDLEKSSKNRIAVVYAEGEIVDGQGGVREVGGERFARQLRQLRLDDNVKAIVLRINSPGGSAQASEIIQREVILTRKVKPVIVSMGNVAASGGYWIATYASRIYAEPTTITGSIGVFGLFPNIQGLANNNGITWDSVKTGRYADIQTISRPKTPAELAIFQRVVDRIYDQFITKVSESRKLPKQKVAEIAQGRVWSGKTAKQLGLVDEIGGLEDAIKAAAQQAQLGDDWRVVEYPKTRSFEERILQSLTDNTHTELEPLPETTTPLTQALGKRSDPFSKQAQRFFSDLQLLQSFNDPMGVYLRLPYSIKID